MSVTEQQIVGAVRSLEISLEERQQLTELSFTAIDTADACQNYCFAIQALVHAREAGNHLAEGELLERIVEKHTKYQGLKLQMAKLVDKISLCK